MSWYDHATLLALRLGPWADAGGQRESQSRREVEAAWVAERQAAETAPRCGQQRDWFRASLSRLGHRRSGG